MVEIFAMFGFLFLAQQEEALGKRVKLSYQTVGVCDDEASDTWDLIMARAQKTPGTPCDLQLLDSAILRGTLFLFSVPHKDCDIAGLIYGCHS